MTTPGAPLEVKADAVAGRLRLSGRLDFSTVAAADAQSTGWLTPAVNELDLAALQHADSAALALLVVWAARVRRQGRAVRYLNVPAGLAALAQSCAVDGLLGFAGAATRPPAAAP